MEGQTDKMDVDQEEEGEGNEEEREEREEKSEGLKAERWVSEEICTPENALSFSLTFFNFTLFQI